MYQAFNAPLLPSPTIGSVCADLSFIRPQPEKPVLVSAALTGGEPVERFAVEERPMWIEDMRPGADAFSLDHHGFLLRRAPSVAGDLRDDRAVEQRYLPEVEQLLRRELGASQVFVFDATRRSDATVGAANKDGARGPASRVHVDYTSKSGLQRARDVLGATLDDLLANGRRVVQINVWRPIGGPVRRSPLALADASSIRFEDLVATDQLFPDRVGEIYHLAHDPSQRWYYAPEMTDEEVLFIKGWDSMEDGRARFTPHSAFRLPDHERQTAARTSIEVRTFVVI